MDNTITSKITSVRKHTDGDYEITTQNALIFIIRGKYGIEPKIGDSVTLHTQGFAFIRGIDLNGVHIFYTSDEKLESDREKWLIENENKKEQDFLENKTSMDAKYDALPRIFKDRIDRFRANNPDFRRDYESYEVFCCEQAILIANECKTVEMLDKFYKMEWAEQTKMVQELSSGHSGNTFGLSCVLAKCFIQDQSLIPKIHGALSALVGSEAYGDIDSKSVT